MSLYESARSRARSAHRNQMKVSCVDAGRPDASAGISHPMESEHSEQESRLIPSSNCGECLYLSPKSPSLSVVLGTLEARLTHETLGACSFCVAMMEPDSFLFDFAILCFVLERRARWSPKGLFRNPRRTLFDAFCRTCDRRQSHSHTQIAAFPMKKRHARL